MGYFDPSRITESTIRDLIREGPPDLALWVFASAFDLEARWKKERNFGEGRNEEAMEGESGRRTKKNEKEHAFQLGG